MSILYRQIAEKILGPSAVLGLFLETSFSGTFSNNYKTQKCQIKIIKRPSLVFREQGAEGHWGVLAGIRQQSTTQTFIFSITIAKQHLLTALANQFRVNHYGSLCPFILAHVFLGNSNQLSEIKKNKVLTIHLKEV